MATDFIQGPNRRDVPSTNHPLQSTVIEPLLWSIGETPPDLSNEIVFEGRTTTTADGREEYTVAPAELSPHERMTRWLTVDSTHVVSLENSR